MVLPLAEAMGGCAKPNCGNRAAIHRHHRAHEALWFGPWAHRRGEPKWEAFCRRYADFREEDIVHICAPHHAEIHSIYDRIITEDIATTGLNLYLYSWRQASILMDKLRVTCAQWLVTDTPGIDSGIYEQTRMLRRSLLNRDSDSPPTRGQELLLTGRKERFRKKKRSKRRKP